MVPRGSSLKSVAPGVPEVEGGRANGSAVVYGGISVLGDFNRDIPSTHAPPATDPLMPEDFNAFWS